MERAGQEGPLWFNPLYKKRKFEFVQLTRGRCAYCVRKPSKEDLEDIPQSYYLSSRAVKSFARYWGLDLEKTGLLDELLGKDRAGLLDQDDGGYAENERKKQAELLAQQQNSGPSLGNGSQSVTPAPDVHIDDDPLLIDDGDDDDDDDANNPDSGDKINSKKTNKKKKRKKKAKKKKKKAKQPDVVDPALSMQTGTVLYDEADEDWGDPMANATDPQHEDMKSFDQMYDKQFGNLGEEVLPFDTVLVSAHAISM
jgi:hypothetical protein